MKPIRCGQNDGWFGLGFQTVMIVFAALILANGRMFSLFGDEGPNQKSIPKPRHEEKIRIQEHHIAVLGVMVEELHPAFASHLPEAVVEGQGVIVIGVTDASPAENSGVQVHDILVTYDDQKLFNADQLSKLVRADLPGREVNLGIVRGGESESLRVKLGDQVVTERAFRHRLPHMTARPPMFPEWMNRMFRERERSPWNVFDSMTLKKIGPEEFSAAIEHTDKDGKLQKHQYEGTRDEIREQIESDKDLSDVQRSHLLQSLGFGPLDLHGEEFLHPDF